MILTPQQVIDTFGSHGYELNPKEIVPFAFRNAQWVPDAWDDKLGIIYDGNRIVWGMGTTQPGKSPLQRDDVNKNGVFILRPDFYKNCFQKGKHKGKYDCLVQFGSGIFKGWRDNDRDGEFDISGTLWDDVRGLNFHTTRWDKLVQRVGDFSEGCMVVHDAKKFDEIMEVVYGSDQALFSLALFQE